MHQNLPKWSESNKHLSKLHIASKGMIETEGAGMLQADFANKFVGGGVLGSGLVQEEIRFTVCPEMIISLLFTEVLHDNEVLVIIGAEQFSEYTGYANSFTFAGRHHDKTQLDSRGRRQTSVVAMDAIRFTRYEAQFRMVNIDRELNKASVGFSDHSGTSGGAHGQSGSGSPGQLQAVATGNWGCGAFCGDVRLKFLIQLMAAAENKRDMAYFTFGDRDLVRDGGDMYKFLVDNNITVGKLYSLLLGYCQLTRDPSGEQLFKYIYQQVKGDQKCSIKTWSEELNELKTELDSFKKAKF